MKPYANLKVGTDVFPFEVLRETNPKRLEVRSMLTTLAGDWKPDIVVGGFCGNCRNNDTQEWDCRPNPSQPPLSIRLHKDGRWRDRHGNVYSLSDKPVRFHDYNL